VSIPAERLVTLSPRPRGPQPHPLCPRLGSKTPVVLPWIGRRASKWIQARADGKLQVRYYSGSGSSTYKGLAIEGYEYRRYQSDTTPVVVTPTWVPLRLPGQYYDAETELLQNRARFYDPQIGRKNVVYL